MNPVEVRRRSHGGIRVSVTAARDHRRIDQLRLAVRPR